MELNFDLHAKQKEIFLSKAKNKITAAGRRGGKSFLAAIELIINGLKDVNDGGFDVSLKEVWYIAPTFNQGKDIMWMLLKDLGKDVIAQALENTATLKLINGRTIKIKGSDRPETLRGPGLSYVVLDEFADMKPEVWEEIVQPMLMEVDGDAFFIGTPKGKNHFYELWLTAKNGNDPDWEAFQFISTDNPYIPEKVVEKMKKRMSKQTFRQELEASFESGGGGYISESMFMFTESSPEPGSIYIAYDPAGFSEVKGKVNSILKKLDHHAIAVVEASEAGWFVHDVIYGRWGIREASLQVIRACQKWKPRICGIEKGMLEKAMRPYLEDQMKRLSIFPKLHALTHGNQNKTDRIMWALQGRFENGRIFFKEDEDGVPAKYVKQLTTELLDFPNQLAHDDCIDALAYIDQLVKIPYYSESVIQNEYEPLDQMSGY
jgi:predicted phage terminase large subunit-like protein